MVKYKWAFLMIVDIDGDSTTKEFLKTLLVIINKSNATNSTVFYTFFIRCNFNTANLLVNNKISEIEYNKPDNFLLHFNGNIENYSILNVDIRTSAGVSKLFLQAFGTSLQAENWGMVTKGHGMVYSFFNAENKIDNPNFLSNIFLNTYFDISTINKLVPINKDTTLDMGELAKGVREGLRIATNGKVKKLDFILMAHCAMAYFDTARKMNEATRYWAAALNNYNTDAIDFSIFFQNFENGNLNKVAQIKKNIPKVNTTNPTADELNNFWLHTSTMLAYDLSFFPKLKKYFYLLLREFFKNSNYHYPKIKKVRTEMSNTHSTYLLIDLFDFVLFLQPHYNKNETVYLLCTQILNLTKPYADDNLILSMYNDENIDKRKQNLNLFFPKDIVEFNSFFNDDVYRANMSLEPINKKVRRPKWEYFIINYYSKNV